MAGDLTQRSALDSRSRPALSRVRLRRRQVNASAMAAGFAAVIVHAVGGEKRQMMGTGEINEGGFLDVLVTQTVALEFDVEAVGKGCGKGGRDCHLGSNSVPLRATPGGPAPPRRL